MADSSRPDDPAQGPVPEPPADAAPAQRPAKKASAKKSSAPKSTRAKKAAPAKKAAAKSSAGKKAVTAKKTAKRAKKTSVAKKAVAAPPEAEAAALGRSAAGAKKATPRKATAKKASAKKASAKKAAAKKSSAKASPAGTSSAGAAAKQSPAKKSTAKKTGSAKKSTPRKAAAKRTAKRGTAKKTAASQGPPRAAAGTTPPGPAAAATTGPEATRGMPDPATIDRSWLLSYPPGVPETYDYPLVPLTRFIDDAAKDFPDTIAVDFLGYTLTYRQLLDQVDRFATALAGLGVGKGDRVGIILPNCPQHVVAIFATLRLGAIVAENNPLYTEAELAHQLADAGCKVVVALDPIYDTKLRNLKGKLPTVTHIITTGIQDCLPFPKNLLFPLKGRKDGTYVKIEESEGTLRFVDLVKRSAPTAVQVPIDPREDLAFLLYTGGTTGVSKGVMLSHFNLVANAFQGRLWFPDIQAGREKVMCVMPFFHSYGLTVCLTVGVLSAGTLVLVPRFDRDQALKLIDKVKPTLFPGVPTMYVALNNAPDVGKYDLSSIRACMSGAAPLPVEVATQFEQLTGGKLREGYGLTETSPITHSNPIYGKAKVGTIGLPVPDTVCTLVDLEDETKPVAPGERGELAISGPQVMRGYWQRPEETAAVLRDGWLLTGDIATIDDEGYFAIVDRKKEMIIAGGYNVYPRDIEEVLYAHPKVEKAVAAGIPDAYRGETVKAYVVLKQGQSLTTEELDAFCRERLAAYKVPKAYEFRDSLPETVVGKVLRRVLIEEEKAKIRT